MSFTHTLTRAYRDTSGNSITFAENVVNNTENNFEDSFADSTTNGEIDWVQVRSKLKSLCFSCDRAVTLKTNSTSAPDDTITLVAGQAIVWSLASDLLARCPISADVTKIYITNASGASCTFKIRALADTTP